MVIRLLFFTFIFFPFFGYALECGNYNIVNSENKIKFYLKNKLIKEVSISYKIQNIDCFYDKLLAITTSKFLFVASNKGKLVTKIPLHRKLQYLYSIDNTIYLKNEEQYLKYHVHPDGSVNFSKTILPITEKSLFISRDKDNKDVIFYKDYYENNNSINKIVPLYLKKDNFYYLDEKTKEIYLADKGYFQKRIDILPSGKLYNESLFLNQFSKFDVREKEKVINYFKDKYIKNKLLFLYLQADNKNRDTILFINKLIKEDGVFTYYETLKKSNFINIPSLGKYEASNIRSLQYKLKNFTTSYDYKFFSKAGNITYKITYPESLENRKVIIRYFLDNYNIFTIEADATCSMFARTKKKGYRSKGFLIFTTVVYESMYEVKEYRCILPKNTIRRIKQTLAILEKTASNIKPLHLKEEWKFEKWKWLYDISAKQTAFGKFLSEAFSGSESTSQCSDISEKCRENCKIKNDKNGFFIFSSSDKRKCESYCVDAEISCNKGEIKKMKNSICRARCVGYNNANGGFFSRSDYEKCIDRCLDDFNSGL